jgi:hypothetical protein
MRIAMGIAFTVAVSACAAPSELAPQVPINAQQVDHTTMRAPAIADTFSTVFSMAEQSARPWERPRSISLGFIGDAPLGTVPTPHHREPEWVRPFPCHWTGTCWMVPMLYGPPYFDGYGGPPLIPR